MISERKQKVLDLFAEGRKHYKLMDFVGAKAAFSKAMEVDPTDGPSKVYLDRCDHYIADPPADDWDGVYVMKTK